MPEEKKMFLTQAYRPRIEYMPARLTRGKIWYISFYAYDPSIDALRRCRVKVNRIKDKNERRLAAVSLMREINSRLHQGWSPFITDDVRSHHLLFEVFDKFLKVKSRSIEPESMRSYVSFVGTLKKWILKAGYNERIKAKNFDRTLASAFMMDLDTNPRISLRTYNNYVAFGRIISNWMREYGFIAANPFEQIRKKDVRRGVKKSRRTLTDGEKKQLFDFLVERERYDYLAMCLLCYYCLMRDKEIVSLRVGDIDLQRQLVRVGDDIAKNDHTSWRTIPDVMVPWLRKLDLSAPAELYLFSYGGKYIFTPGKERVCERKVAKYWSDVIRPALGWGLDLKFYSLKDTGITDMATAGVPLNLVKEQADHSSLEMTGIYMGDSGGKAHESIKKISTFYKKSEK